MTGIAGLLCRIATLGRRPSKLGAHSAPNSRSPTVAGAAVADLSVADILTVAQKSGQEVAEMARVGAATAALLPLLQGPASREQCSSMRAHAHAATAALVLTREDQLIQELCRHGLSYNVSLLSKLLMHTTFELRHVRNCFGARTHRLAQPCFSIPRAPVL